VLKNFQKDSIFVKFCGEKKILRDKYLNKSKNECAMQRFLF